MPAENGLEGVEKGLLEVEEAALGCARVLPLRQTALSPLFCRRLRSPLPPSSQLSPPMKIELPPRATDLVHHLVVEFGPVVCALQDSNPFVAQAHSPVRLSAEALVSNSGHHYHAQRRGAAKHEPSHTCG
eukprot:3095842-Rhodomonas_salina.2